MATGPLSSVGAGPAPPTGLTTEEAASLLEEHGANSVPTARPRTLLARVATQLRDPMILLLCGALVVVVLIGDVTDAAVICAVVVLNTVLGVVQEVRAAHAMAALQDMAAPTAVVVRDGQVRKVEAVELVPGDVIRLEAGSVVAADARLVEAVSLQVDESAMTGESVPVDRVETDEVLAGTVVTRGRGVAVVLRTGAHSGLGRIAGLVAATGARATPLQARLARLSRTLVAVTGALAGLVLVLGVLRGQDPVEMLVLAVSLAVAAVPESLPAVVSVALALGAYRMARRSAVVRWLPAVETLGSVTVLASDKTGTLTEGRMEVEQVWVPGRPPIDAGGGDGDPPPPVVDLLTALVLCNDAHPGSPSTAGAVGDPLEVALLRAADRCGVSSTEARERWPRSDEVPFDAVHRMMRTLHRAGESWLTVSKGAPEVVLGAVRPVADADEARAQAEAWAQAGYRVIAASQSVRTGERPSWDAAGDAQRLLGLVALDDPPRPQAAQVVQECRDAGVRTVLITGDHPATARAIAEQVGILGDGLVVEGDMVARGEHVALVDRISVYARTRPEQKVDIVSAWQGRGAVVAMTGDGVNDAPALRRADIGVAMGDRGTEVARQAADLVLADDDLGTVLAAIAEGRRIYTNIRTFLRYGLSGGAAEVMVILLGPFLGMPVPLAPAQILWINMLTHGIPGVAFGGEPLDDTVMTRPSRSPERSVLGDGLWQQAGATGLLIAAVSIVAGALAGAGTSMLQSAIFLTLGLSQLGVGLALRAPRHGVGWSERGLELSLALAAVLQVAAVSWPPLCDFLGTTQMSPADFLTFAALAGVPGIVVALGRRWGGRGAAR